MFYKLHRIYSFVVTVIGLYAHGQLLDIYWNGLTPVILRVWMDKERWMDMRLGTAQMRLEEVRRIKK